MTDANWGISASGFYAPTLQEVIDDYGEKILANVDSGLDLSPDGIMGKIVATFAQRIWTGYQTLATIYQSVNPQEATGDLLRQRCAISGTLAEVPSYSTVPALLTLTANSTVLAGAVAAVASEPSNRWVLVDDVTSTDAGNYAGLFRSSSPGHFECIAGASGAGTLTVISTPQIGWTSVQASADATPGRTGDNDQTLRVRRITELAGEGGGKLAGILADVLKSDANVTDARAFENTTLATDALGTPAKSFRIVIFEADAPASSDAVAQAIWNARPAGIPSVGAQSGNAVDRQGVVHVVNFDRAQALPVFVACTTTPASLTTDQTNLVKQAIVNFVSNLGLGQDLIARRFAACPLEPTDAIFESDGVTVEVPAYDPSFLEDIPSWAFGLSASPTLDVNLSASGLQVFTCASGDVKVNGI